MGCHVVETASGKLALRFRWTPPDGRRRYFSLTTEHAAGDETARRRLEGEARIIGAKIRAGQFHPADWYAHFGIPAPRFGTEAPWEKPKPGATLADRMTLWIDQLEARGVRRSRVRDYRQHAAAYIKPVLGGLAPERLGFEDLNSFLVRLVTPKTAGGFGLGEKSARNIIRGTLRAFLRDVGADLSPFERLRWERYVPREGAADPFTAAERERILEHFRKKLWRVGLEKKPCRPLHVYFEVAFYRGCRHTELAGFNVGDYDRRTRTLAVRRSRHLGSEGAPKTVASQRHVFLDERLAGLVESLTGVRDPDAPLFTDQWARAVNVDNLGDSFADALTALGIAHRPMKQTRHTCAVLRLEAGENPVEVARDLGHSLATLEKHYAPVLRRARERQLHQDIAPCANAVDNHAKS